MHCIFVEETWHIGWVGEQMYDDCVVVMMMHDAW